MTDTHWDAKGGADGAGALVGLAHAWHKGDENWIVSLDVQLGTGTGLVRFPGMCSAVDGSSAFNPSTRTLYATLQCAGSSDQIFAFDIANQTMEKMAVFTTTSNGDLMPMVIDMSTAAAASAAPAAPAPLLGIQADQHLIKTTGPTSSKSHLIKITGPTSSKVVVANIPGVPGGSSANWIGGILYLQTIRVRPLTPVLLGVDPITGNVT